MTTVLYTDNYGRRARTKNDCFTNVLENKNRYSRPKALYAVIFRFAIRRSCV